MLCLIRWDYDKGETHVWRVKQQYSRHIEGFGSGAAQYVHRAPREANCWCIPFTFSLVKCEKKCFLGAILLPSNVDCYLTIYGLGELNFPCCWHP